MPTQTINLNDSLPAPPAGLQNNKWQADPPSLDPTVIRDVSTYTPLATTSLPGSVQPDGDTLTVDGSGKISLASGVSAKTANYLATASDNGQLLVFNSASAVTLTLPAAPPTTKWRIHVQNIGAGALTISPNGLQLDGASGSLSVAQNQGTQIATDGTNYFTERGMGSSGSGLTDPTTTLGDLIVRGASAPTRLGVGTDGQVLTARSTATDGIDWEAPSGGNGILTLTPPVLSNFTWVNQGTATAVQNGNTIFVQTPNLAGDNIRLLVKSIPAAPKRIAIWFLGTMWQANYCGMGLALRESSSGKLVVFAAEFNSGSTKLGAVKYNSPTSYNSDYSGSPSTALSIPWPVGLSFRLDTGGNRYFDFSVDGPNWINQFSTLNTDFITPDQIGFYVNAGGNGNAVSMSLLSYSES